MSILLVRSPAVVIQSAQRLLHILNRSFLARPAIRKCRENSTQPDPEILGCQAKTSPSTPLKSVAY